MTDGLSENLLPTSTRDVGESDFSGTTNGGIVWGASDGRGSILGGGIPVSRSKGAWEAVGEEILGVAGPASSGVRKAFSHDPARGSLDESDEELCLVKLGPGRLDDMDGVIGAFSTRSSAT